MLLVNMLKRNVLYRPSCYIIWLQNYSLCKYYYNNTAQPAAQLVLNVYNCVYRNYYVPTIFAIGA